MNSRTRAGQAGFSLMELLVASTIGLLLLAATGQIFLSSKQSFTAQEALGNIQENARLAMFFLQRDIRMAGYPKENSPPAFVLRNGNGACPAVTACTYTGGTPNVNNPSATLGTGETCVAGTGSFNCANGQSDQIEVQLKSDRDCLGRAVPFVSGTGAHVANRYYVAIDPTTRVRRLMCNSFSLNPVGGFAQTAMAGGEQPLVEGIESLQILYGIDANSDPAALVLPVFATSYVRADQLSAATLDLDKIISVRVAVLASSVSATGTIDNAAQRYLALDAPVFTRNDLLRRRVFTSTIELRNRSL